MKNKYTMWNTKPIMPDEFNLLLAKIKSEFELKTDKSIGAYLELADEEVTLFLLRYDNLRLYPIGETPGSFNKQK